MLINDGVQKQNKQRGRVYVFIYTRFFFSILRDHKTILVYFNKPKLAFFCNFNRVRGNRVCVFKEKHGYPLLFKDPRIKHAYYRGSIYKLK